MSITPQDQRVVLDIVVSSFGGGRVISSQKSRHVTSSRTSLNILDRVDGVAKPTWTGVRQRHKTPLYMGTWGSEKETGDFLCRRSVV